MQSWGGKKGISDETKIQKKKREKMRQSTISQQIKKKVKRKKTSKNCDHSHNTGEKCKQLIQLKEDY